MDHIKFLDGADTISKFIVDFKKNDKDRDRNEKVSPHYISDLLEVCVKNAHTWEETFNLIKKILIGKRNWEHPLFFGFFPAGASYASILADFLSSAINNNGFSWSSSPCCLETELLVLNWLGKAFGLPTEMLPYSAEKVLNQRGGGTILGSASECIFTSLASAVYEKNAPRHSLVVYTSVMAHLSVEKACRFLGVSIVKISVDDITKSMRPEALSDAILFDRATGKVPVAVVLTIGTTSCGAIDEIVKLSDITKKEELYLHVDGAYGGAALLMKKFHKKHSLQNVDAININPNKCLQTTLCCSCLWMRDRRPLLKLQPKAFYLDYSEEDDYQFKGQQAAGLSLSRPFRALKLFFVLLLIGVHKLRNDLVKLIVLAEHIKNDLFRMFPTLVFVKPSMLPVFCFRTSSDRDTLALLKRLNDTRQTYFTPTTLEDDRMYIRLSINNNINKDWKLKFYSIMETQYHHIKDATPSTLLCVDFKAQINFELGVLSKLFGDYTPTTIQGPLPSNFAGTLHLKFDTFLTAYSYLLKFVETTTHLVLPKIATIYYHTTPKFIIILFDIDSSKVRKLNLTKTDTLSVTSSIPPAKSISPFNNNLIQLDTYISDEKTVIFLPVETIRARK